MKFCRVSVLLVALGVVLIACGGGGGGSSSGTTITPYPYPTAESYPTPPIEYLPNVPVSTSARHMGLSIAYGTNGNSDAINLVSLVTMVNFGGESDEVGYCSATPIAYESGTTWLVGAAHCFVKSKSESTVVQTSELLGTTDINLCIGNLPLSVQHLCASPIESAIVYIPTNYCYGSTFTSFSGCPNFLYDSSNPTLQSNDIALIAVNGQLGNTESYAVLVESTQYPTAYTMAPILELGYGLQNEGTPQVLGQLQYVTGYYYQLTDNPGYHQLFNSYFSAANNGYIVLFCDGDSGGGDLFWNGESWLLLSEHSFGVTNSCGLFFPYLPNGSTNVSSYYSWITGIRQNGPTYCNNADHNCVTNAPI